MYVKLNDWKGGRGGGGGGGCKNFSTNRKFRVKNLEQISELSALYSKRKMLQRKKKKSDF
jgi:hypothetical protein